MHTHSPTASSTQAGSITVVAVFFALLVAGLCVAMVEMGLASRRTQSRCDSNLYALEAAEAGTVFAEQEVQAQTDPGGDGIGTLQGSYAGGRFTVTATVDPADPLRYTLVTQGTHGPISRRIETGVMLLPGSPWEYAVFAKSGMTFGSSNASTDAYDSRLGSYASQAVNLDATGPYAQAKGTIGSNGTINLANQTTIHGSATPGPGDTVTVGGSTVVTGSTAPRSEELDLPPTQYSEFLAASLTNDNGMWTVKGKAPTYNPVTKALSLGSGNVLTLTGKTYFFSSLKLSGGATLKVDGPVKIYITDEAALGGGVVINTTMAPINLQIYQQPYALPLGYTPKYNTTSLSGGANTALVMYAPNTPVTMSGNGALFGAVVCDQFTMKGGAKIHFDLALRAQMKEGRDKLHRLYWRDLNPPLR